ncbi:hypothetical protein A3860_31125 [Niastella vici]|uniref:Uncharacterized protein n=1 Tax=Niastella vici TaxID=1703345 RepID=A0A1V9FTL8_9BACT|nr:hypothetical protein [Niastella vici]OQP61719.1 hypothetical protein A3860_31125 [Niastella vici]
MRLTNNNGKYTEQLNELIQYKMICIAYKGEQVFFYSQAVIEAKVYTAIELSPIDRQELKQQLNRAGIGHQGTDLQKDLEFYQFMNKDAQRQQHYQDLRELRMKTANVLFSCKEGISCCYFVPAK